MDLKKIPPSMALVLGLACNDGKEKETVGPCLSPATEDDGNPTSTVGPCLDVDPVTSNGETATGPCLSTTGWEQTSTGTTGTTGADSTIGPCLTPEPPTGTGTDTGTGTGGETDTDGTTGMMGNEPSDSRAAALERVLSRNVLPADVAARLRGSRSEP